MASPYTANKDATQSPSPAPAPRALPIITIPAGFDVRTIESITQEMKVKTDFIGHIQSAVGLDVPVLNSGSTGFTAPTYSAFGGTVAPSGSVHIADGTRFVVQIQLGGAVGVATFKTSIDGGNTYGALQTTSASMTDATSGITLAFAGTLTAAGTATFRAAFTPLAEWRDSLGNTRSLVEHNGYSAARLNRFEERWFGVANSALTAGTGTSGQWDYTVPTNGTTQKGSAGSDIPATVLSHSLAAVTTGQNYLFRTNTAFMIPQSFTSLLFWWEMKMNTIGANNCDWFVGLSNADGGTPGNNNICGVGKQSADTNWQLITGNNSAFTKTNSGVVPIVSTAQKFALELQGSASQYGGVARLWINGVMVESTATLPITTQAMKFHIDGTTVGTSTMSFTVGPVEGVWNRYASAALY